MLNENGIIPIDLNINSSRQVTIQNAVISANFFSDIFINWSVWNLNVMNCSFMSNEVGIYVSGKTNANITHNSVAYNEIGVLYDHVSHDSQPTTMTYITILSLCNRLTAQF